jgi:hypothetical protein
MAKEGGYGELERWKCQICIGVQETCMHNVECSTFFFNFKKRLQNFLEQFNNLKMIGIEKLLLKVTK